eukprot:CAMPEP_0175148610 /NCGR_PEP_ID=MMETSP0087-20121206/16733_1 /TAXON_ID=136419 /ORGANISM="Unknown Unknown, Strain D1" /LENGTH=594 /DNA_ID=CAMNT_0016434109 /DNA_START=33 /DNA_END=1817 /DNA_ORIENTATION=-
MKIFISLLLSSVCCAAPWYSSYRKDHYTDPKLYPELFGPNPTTGGRAHYVLQGKFSGQPAFPLTVSFNKGKTVVPQIPDYSGWNSTDLDWARVEVNDKTGKVWVSLHSTKDDFMSGIAQITVTDSKQAVICDESVTAANSEIPVEVTWVTSQKNFTELVVHLQNSGKSSVSVSNLVVNGEKQSDVSLSAGEHTVLVYPLHTALLSVWTVEYSIGSGNVGFGGTLLREVFPFEDWPKGGQCPFPESNQSNFELFKDLGVDTHFFNKNKENSCTDDWQSILKNARANNYWLLPSEFTEKPDELPFQDGVLGLFISDEGDDNYGKCRDEFSRHMQRRRDYPGLPTYQGGKTSKFNGAFAGITDIQGMDFYTAGCAPHVTSGISKMRIQGAHDYLLNTRNNMKPGAVWGYSQFLCSDCWDVKALSPGETTAQIASVFAASNKGMMLFQTDYRSVSNPAWASSKAMFASFKPVKELLRVGDKMQAGVTWSASPAQVTVIQAPTALVVIAVSWNADGYNDLTCAIGFGAGAHWHFSELKGLSATIQLPAGFVPGNVQESTGSGLVPAKISASTSGSTLSLAEIDIGKDITARVFVVNRKV